MAVDVTVHLPKIGSPNFSHTARQLGQISRAGSRLTDVWELVRLIDGKVSLDPQEVAQIDACRFVKDLHIHVRFGLEYFVASDLQNNVTNAKNSGNTALANFHRWLLLRVEGHALEHYKQFIEVIMTWEGDIKNDLAKALPTDQKPTSMQEEDIKKAIGALVSDWIVELEFRLKQAAFDWEHLDYPQIETQMNKYPGASVFMPMGFSLPNAPKGPASRTKVKFPPCRP
jgi:hypothetical protein